MYEAPRVPLPRGSREGFRERTQANLVDEDGRQMVSDEDGRRVVSDGVDEKADVAELL